MNNILIQTPNRQDKFGYYTVGELKFYSKTEALLAEVKTGLKHVWHFNDEVFSSYNWRTEPSQSLDELYRMRAQQLRDQYDYLILWYSGGADSDNILRSFIENDIKLDEVASYVNYEFTGSKEHMQNAEIFFVAYPNIEIAKQKQPWLIHRIEDYSNDVHDLYKKTDNQSVGIDWIYDLNGWLSVNALAKQEIKTRIAEWNTLYEQGKRVCHIYGIDKPIIRRAGNRYIFHFWDRIDNAVTPRSQRLNRAWEFNELFYWTPDLPELIIKQAHAVKKYLRKPTVFDQHLETNTGYYVHTVDRNGNRFNVSHETINSLIYPKWKPIPYQVKGNSAIYSSRDDWFHNLSETEIIKRNHRVGLEELWRITPDEYKHDPTNIKHERGFKPTISKTYDIGF